jgi:hypothetical protein
MPRVFTPFRTNHWAKGAQSCADCVSECRPIWGLGQARSPEWNRFYRCKQTTCSSCLENHCYHGQSAHPAIHLASLLSSTLQNHVMLLTCLANLRQFLTRPLGWKSYREKVGQRILKKAVHERGGLSHHSMVLQVLLRSKVKVGDKIRPRVVKMVSNASHSLLR